MIFAGRRKGSGGGRLKMKVENVSRIWKWREKYRERHVRILDMCYHVQIHNSYGSVRLGTDDPCDFRSSGFSCKRRYCQPLFRPMVVLMLH